MEINELAYNLILYGLGLFSGLFLGMVLFGGF